MNVFALIIKDDQTLSDILSQKKDDKLYFIAKALYLKPNNIDTKSDNYSVLEIPIETRYSWGIDLKGGYYLSDTKNWYIEWLHYRNTDNDNTLLGQQITGEPETLIHHGYQSSFDIVTLNLGQWITLKNGLMFNLHAGFAYAALDLMHRFNYQTDIIPRLTQRYFKSYQYKLYGTNVGLNIDYLFTPNVDILLNASVLTLHRGGEHHYLNEEVFTGVNVVLKDIEIKSQLNGIMYGTDIESLLHYNIYLSSSVLSLSAGARGVIFLDDFAKWAGGTFGMKWRGSL